MNLDRIYPHVPPACLVGTGHSESYEARYVHNHGYPTDVGRWFYELLRMTLFDEPTAYGVTGKMQHILAHSWYDFPSIGKGSGYCMCCDLFISPEGNKFFQSLHSMADLRTPDDDLDRNHDYLYLLGEDMQIRMYSYPDGETATLFATLDVKPDTPEVGGVVWMAIADLIEGRR